MENITITDDNGRSQIDINKDISNEKKYILKGLCILQLLMLNINNKQLKKITNLLLQFSNQINNICNTSNITIRDDFEEFL